MQTLLKFKQFVDEITADNSRLYKESILAKYKEDEDIKYYLNFLLNPYIVTGISNKKLYKELLDFYAPVHHNKVIAILLYLQHNSTGTDRDIAVIQSFKVDNFEYSYGCNETDLCQIFNGLVTKNLPLGVDAKTVNKIIPGLIPTFNVMLANKYFDNPKVINGKEFAITTKIDGMRCIMLKENGNVTFWSRQGQQIEGLVDLEEEAKYFPDNICLDGELIAIVDNPYTYKDTMKRARTKDVEKHGLKMMVFDIMAVDEFKNQECHDSYKRRALLLKSVMNCQMRDVNDNLLIKPIHDFKYFERLNPLYIGTDTSKIIELLNEQTSKGEEGIMLNICDAPYEFKRSNVLLKVKKFQDTEVKVVGFEAGINRLSDTLGALTCDYNGNTVKVGSGFSDELRKEIWEHQEDWLNKVITVKYFEESYDSKTGLKSLRFPIYMRVKEDC